MRVGHVFVGLVFLWALPVSERPLNNISLTSRHLTSWCSLGAYFPSGNIILGRRNWSFLDIVSVPVEFLGSRYCVHNNSYGVGSNKPLCLWNLDAVVMQKQDSHLFHRPRSSSGAINVPVAIIPIQWLFLTCH